MRDWGFQLTIPPLSVRQHGELARNNIAPHHSFGLDTARPDNLKYIEPGKVMYAAGNTLIILEVSTMKRRVIFGLDGGGVGCFAVHPTGTLIAVGDKGSMPNIYIYEYPSFKIAKVGNVLSRYLRWVANDRPLWEEGRAWRTDGKQERNGRRSNWFRKQKCWMLRHTLPSG